MYRHRGGRLLACSLGFGAACSGQSSTGGMQPSSSVGLATPPAVCNADSDCATDKHCIPTASERHLQVIAPCPNTQTPCTTDASCTTGTVCEPIPYGSALPSCLAILATCNTPCTTDGTGRACGDFDSCQPNGHCERQRCDDPDFIGCPSTMQCDPTYIWDADPNIPLGKYSLYGTQGVTGPTIQERTAAETGCVFRACTTPEGYQCLADLRCDPEHAEPSSSGCFAVPCAELGHCSNDDYYVCAPTSNRPHAEGLDAHGCTYRNCEERSCGTGYTCDFDSPKSDASGCRRTLCNEPGGDVCDAYTKCAPEDPAAYAWGCAPRQCDSDGFDCSASNAVCAPADPVANQFGCVPASTPVTTTAAPPSSTSPSAPGSTTAPVTSSKPVATASGNIPPAASTSLVAVNASPLPSPPSNSAASFIGVCR